MRVVMKGVSEHVNESLRAATYAIEMIFCFDLLIRSGLVKLTFFPFLFSTCEYDDVFDRIANKATHGDSIVYCSDILLRSHSAPYP